MDDNGPGVPEAQRTRLFDPFFSTREERPVGIGLAVCQRLVVAAGGDGTANEVGSGLLDSEAVLGLMPMGSGNAFARALGLPIDPAKALGEILAGDVLAIDAGTVAGRHFFSTAGVGLDAAVCHLYASRPDRRRGFLPYLALTLRASLLCSCRDRHNPRRRR